MMYKVTYVDKTNYDHIHTGFVDGTNMTDAYVRAELRHGDKHIITDVRMYWGALHFGRVSPSEVQEAVHDEQWQQIRLSMKGMSTEDKYKTLEGYLQFKRDMLVDEHEMRMVHVRITNYVTALSRGGIIKPEDYR